MAEFSYSKANLASWWALALQRLGVKWTYHSVNSLIWSRISDITQKTGVLLSHLNSPGNRIASDCRTSPKNWTFFTAAATKLPYTQSLTTTPKPATWFSALFATSTFIFEKPLGGRHQLGWLVFFLFSKWFELGILNLL